MKNIYLSFLLSVLFAGISSCQKEEPDPTLPPVIETTSSLDAENKITKLIADGSSMDFLIDLQDDNFWRACYASNNLSNVFAYGISVRIIVSKKQKRIDRQMRNVVTVYSGYRFNIYSETNYFARIYNSATTRFYTVTTSKSVSSPDCNSLKYYFTAAQAFGGTFLK